MQPRVNQTSATASRSRSSSSMRISQSIVRSRVTLARQVVRQQYDGEVVARLDPLGGLEASGFSLNCEPAISV
ncbi:hypothetical protein [Bradyrhizobium sp. USDA 3650]